MMPSCFREIYRVARKRHKCCECGGIIEPLDVYQYISGVWDGEPESFKTCTPCVEARDFYEEHFKELRDPDDGAYTLTALQSDLTEAACDLFGCEPGFKFKTWRLVAKMKQRRAAWKTTTGKHS